MKAKPEEIRSIVALMDRQYGDIRELEQAWSIFGAEGDYRPRIDYYHDAVRAFSAGDAARDKHSRLSAERLAYDAAMLRQIQAKPTTAGRGKQHFAAGDALVVAGAPGSLADPDRETRDRLKKLYKDYAVLFVALLAEKADRNAETRTEEANLVVADCAMLKEMMQKFARGQIGMAELLSAVEQIEHDELRRAVRTLLASKRLQPKDVAQAMGTLDQAKRGADGEIRQIDQAMLNFSAQRLHIYEESRDVVKGMAAKGMNIAGKFVENAMSQSGGKGRGV